MDVLSPFFVLNLLWLMPGILVLYFLRLRREEVVVPSVLLWQHAVQDLRVNTPFQRLTRNLLLFLQLLLAALLILALMRPVLSGIGHHAELLILLVDTSGSMRTRDCGDLTRLEEACRVAGEFIDDLARDDEALIVSFDAQARVVSPPTGDRARLLRALASLEPSDLRTEIAPALRAVRGYLTTSLPPRVVLLSDGAFPTADLVVEEMIPDLRYVQVGEERGNISILAVDALRALDAGRTVHLTATLGSTMPGPEEVPLTVSLDGSPVAVRTVTVDGLREDGSPGREVVSLEGLEGHSGLLELTLETDDPLAEDDHAYLVLRPEAAIRVLLVSREGDPFLRRALTVDERVTLEEMSTEQFASQHDGPAGTAPPHDVVIFDAWAPQAMLPRASLFLGALPPVEGFAATGQVERPRYLDQAHGHALTRFLNFAPVSIERALVLEVPPEAAVLWETRQTPILAALSTGTHRVIVSGISTVDSDWVLTPTFPIFVAHALDWLAGGAVVGSARRYTAGDVISLELPREVTSVVVETPDGEQRSLQPGLEHALVHLADTRRAGFYQLWAAGENEEPLDTVAVCFDSPHEGDIRPVAELDMPGVPLPAITTEEVRTRREIWRPVLLVLLLLLLLEWWYYHHRSGSAA